MTGLIGIDAPESGRTRARQGPAVPPRRGPGIRPRAAYPRGGVRQCHSPPPQDSIEAARASRLAADQGVGSATSGRVYPKGPEFRSGSEPNDKSAGSYLPGVRVPRAGLFVEEKAVRGRRAGCFGLERARQSRCRQACGGGGIVSADKEGGVHELPGLEPDNRRHVWLTIWPVGIRHARGGRCMSVV